MAQIPAFSPLVYIFQGNMIFLVYNFNTKGIPFSVHRFVFRVVRLVPICNYNLDGYYIYFILL